MDPSLASTGTGRPSAYDAVGPPATSRWGRGVFRSKSLDGAEAGQLPGRLSSTPRWLLLTLFISLTSWTGLSARLPGASPSDCTDATSLKTSPRQPSLFSWSSTVLKFTSPLLCTA
ncbi:hypothetical protein H920_15298 [Fukomys damarensis]|uniref:Uncharacterized protein n=1 Tax=Fukomys damarensis TaxID=885580 RepID=A0A091CXF2_FUKDA|nr:hypothetical protein H920_15298 [Fukomys damarensis]